MSAHTEPSKRPQKYCAQPHGTFTRYAAGCSCPECCDAWAAHSLYRKRNGAPNPLVDANPMHQHIKRLGMTLQALARSSGISYTVLLDADKDRSRRVRKETLDAVLAVKSPAANHRGRVDLKHAARVLDELCERFGVMNVADACGFSASFIWAIRTGAKGKRFVQADTLLRIQQGRTKLYGVRSLDREAVAMFALDGLNDEQIAEHMGCSPSAITKARKEAVA